jgi:hypothetical protein
MEISYYGSVKGKKLYKVLKLNGNQVFLGTLGECKRFIKVHREKVKKHYSKNRLSKEDALDLLGNEMM